MSTILDSLNNKYTQAKTSYEMAAAEAERIREELTKAENLMLERAADLEVVQDKIDIVEAMYREFEDRLDAIAEGIKTLHIKAAAGEVTASDVSELAKTSGVTLEAELSAVPDEAGISAGEVAA